MTLFARTSTTALALIFIAACSSAPIAPVKNENSGRYSISQDRAPTRVVDIASVPEVVPVPINRTGAGNRSPYTVLGKSYTVMPTEVGYTERGVASWYGEKFHGHKTSNGEIFDMYKASAAHKSLPIPSFLKVTNLDNNRSIVVRVNDRGPFHGDRIIDLSYAAAAKLGYSDRGTARVYLESIVVTGDSDGGSPQVRQPDRVANSRSSSDKYLQVGAFSKLDAARSVSSELRNLTDRPVFIRSVNTLNNGVMHRVRIGPLASANEISRLSRRVEAANLGTPYTVTE
ncbi:MAG: septal ring lytic transglycosylase RlpA family protein [Pseudohongiellaceae bacterium]